MWQRCLSSVRSNVKPLVADQVFPTLAMALHCRVWLAFQAIGHGWIIQEKSDGKIAQQLLIRDLFERTVLDPQDSKRSSHSRASSQLKQTE